MAKEQRFQVLIQRALARFSSEWGRLDSLLSTVLPVLVVGSDLPDAESVARACACQVVPRAGTFPTISFTVRVEVIVSEVILFLRSWNGTTGAPNFQEIGFALGTYALGTPPSTFNPFELSPLDPATTPMVPAAGVLLFTPQFRPTLAFDAGNALMIASCTTVLNPLIGITGRADLNTFIDGLGTIGGFRVRWDPPLILPAGFFLVFQFTNVGTTGSLPALGATVRYRETR